MPHQTQQFPVTALYLYLMRPLLLWVVALRVWFELFTWQFIQFVLTHCSVSAVSARGCPCDAGRSGYLVIQRSDGGQHQPRAHPRSLSRVAPAEPAAEDQARQCTVHHVRDAAVFFYLPPKKTRWCVELLELASHTFIPPLHSEVWILMVPLSA